MEGFIRKEAAARALEARLREVSKNARNFYDHPVRQLRTRLRDAYADVLLEDPTLAQVAAALCAQWLGAYTSNVFFHERKVTTWELSAGPRY